MNTHERVVEVTDIVRSHARRSELEISSIPEVAALATELTTLFNGLEVPQQQYAVRVMLDKSTVSRFLNGRRVASQDFIDRLFSELERHRRTKITEETRAQIRGLRLAALRETDQASFQLENLRDELDKSHRAIRMLERQQEALELLLDQREAAAENAEREIHELRGVWISERRENETTAIELTKRNEKLKSDSERLQDEISELKEQLAQVTHLKTGAEDRCSRLEERLLEAERRLAEQLDQAGEQAFNLSPQEAFEEIRTSETHRRYYDAARTLSLSAAHFSVSDLAELWDLLLAYGRPTEPTSLISDAIRFRSAEFCAHITEDLLTRKLSFDQRKMIGTLLGTYKAPEELDYLYSRWKTGGPPYGVLRYTFREWATLAPPRQVGMRLTQLAQDSDTTISVGILYSYGTRDVSDIFLLSDWLLGTSMAEEFQTLFLRWFPTILEAKTKETEKKWMKLSAESRYGDILRGAFEGHFPRMRA